MKHTLGLNHTEDGNGYLEREGFAIAAKVLTPSQRQELIDALGPLAHAGRRGLLGIPMVSKLACSPSLLDLVRPHLASDPAPVRAIYFDKSPHTNWAVAWHQDLTVAAGPRVEIPGFGPWSIKEGVPHVQPPIQFLEQMLTVRLHLDDCDERNGALRVIPGSHRFGRISAERLKELRERNPDFVCRLSAGDALLMRPLLLHASGRSKSPCHRRVLHIEYAGFSLPSQLQWCEMA